MRKDIAELWITELRSNYWQQGKYFLEHSGYFCVFGVLVNIAATEGICSHTGNNIGQFDNSMLIVPQSVLNWAELKTETGEVPSLKYSLAEYNDNGKSFQHLANLIERHWSDL